MGRKASPTLIGAFVLGALALAVVGVAIFGSGRIFRKTQEFVLYFDRSVNGLRAGAPVKFKGVEIGAVTRIELSLSHRLRTPGVVRIPVVIELDARRISERGGQLTLTQETLEDLVGQGLRGQLSTESFVTGVLYIELDFHPASPVHLMAEPEVTLLEIPTLPTALEQVQSRVTEIISKLSEVDFRLLVDRLSETVDGLHALVTAPELKAAVSHTDDTLANLNATVAEVRTFTATLRTNVDPTARSLRATAEEAEATLAGLRLQLAPGSPLFVPLGQTLTELGEAARALRGLADELQRNPSALVRGKPTAEDHR
jgi:paraquat-inducible protein B